MSFHDQAPYQAQDPQQVLEMVQALQSKSKKGGKGSVSVKKTTFKLPSGRNVDSWRMQDWDYKKEGLPTYARGIFTTLNPSTGKPEIVVRGYDKFFNHGEVRSTEWRNVETNTIGPYELSVKENGCIIFISGMDDGSLIVCSKHSTGARGDTELSHAQAGEKWVDRHLATVGKTREQLAKTLREMNATAVAELCDDEFEEHVLAYTPEQAGLYLHGINLNLPEFATYPGPYVDAFADEWGFKKTMYLVEKDIKRVKEFLDGIAETGAYAGRDTEGFVIRCRARDKEGTPYHDWFFKYKFEEPYLMYRQWRECTKSIIAGKAPRVRKHKKITEEYLLYARRRLAQDPKLGKLYNQNHGIIKLREDFLADKGVSGAEVIREEIERGELDPKHTTQNVVLVPIATLGCGKTTVGLALVKLFGWGIVQNDNITVRHSKPMAFATACTSMLAAHPVVVADRNNHQKRERAQIIGDISKIVPNAQFVALHYVHDRAKYDKIREVTRARVLNRGDNHQTIQAGSKSSEEIIGIMEGFMNRFQPLDPSEEPDDGFDKVIELDVTASSRDNLETVVTHLHNEYPRLFGEMPTADDLDKVIQEALNDYTPDIKHDVSRNFKQSKKQQEKQERKQKNAGPKKQPGLEYFAVSLPTERVNTVLEATFKDQDANTTKFYNQLKNGRRVQPAFHVTLMHRASVSQHPQYWEQLSEMHKETVSKAMAALSIEPEAPLQPELGKCLVHFERLVWDDRIMTFVVRLDSGAAAAQQSEGSAGVKFESVNQVAHVTVGTVNTSVKPKESNDLLQRWLEAGSSEENGIKELKIKGSIVMDGVVKGILQRY